mgnify:CR=1 FL=1
MHNLDTKQVLPIIFQAFSSRTRRFLSRAMLAGSLMAGGVEACGAAQHGSPKEEALSQLGDNVHEGIQKNGDAVACASNLSDANTEARFMLARAQGTPDANGVISVTQTGVHNKGTGFSPDMKTVCVEMGK